MGRFKKFRAPKITTVIGRETEIHGDVQFLGGLHVDGSVKGNVTGTDERCALIISESGSIEGDVRVANIILNGAITGDVYVSGRAELAPEARVNGTLYYRLLEMAIGAEVNGQLVHVEEEETRMLSYDGSAEKSEDVAPTDREAKREGEPEPVSAPAGEKDAKSGR
jgi:cytoskeletal protein CcmA (bactofilin family)